MTGTILLIIGLSLLGLYLLLVIIDIIFFLSFKSIFNKHDKAAVILMNNKLDSLTTFFNYAKENGIEVEERIFELASSIKKENLTNGSEPECKEAREKLSKLRDEAIIFYGKHHEIESVQLCVDIRQNLTELENIFRSTTIMYNADVLGYNYWVSFWPCRYIYKIFKVKTKETI